MRQYREMIAVSRGTLGGLLRRVEEAYPRSMIVVLAGFAGEETVIEGSAVAGGKTAGVVGACRSCPDLSAVPLEDDFSRTRPGEVLMLVSVRAGIAAEWVCWVPDAAGKGLEPAAVRLTD